MSPADMATVLAAEQFRKDVHGYFRNRARRSPQNSIGLSHVRRDTRIIVARFRGHVLHEIARRSGLSIERARCLCAEFLWFAFGAGGYGTDIRGAYLR